MDVKLSIEEKEIAMNASIKEVQNDEEGASMKEETTATTAEQQDPSKVYLAARKLADVIKGGNVKDICFTIETLANQTDYSAIFNFRGLSWGSLFHVAAATGNGDILGLLLDQCDTHLIVTQDCWGNTPLHIATKAKASGVADMLITRARQLHSVENILRIKNKHGNTALHEAVLTCDVGLVSHLLREDLEPVYWMNVDQKSPLYLALDTRKSKMHQVLFSLSLDPSRIQGLPPVHGAIVRRNYDLVAKILEWNLKMFAMTDSKGGNAFHLAAFLNWAPVFDLLQSETEHLAREPDMDGELPIHIASKMGHVALIKKLLSVSELINKQGQTVLHVAAKYGRAFTVRHILRHPDLGILINERDNEGNTALHLAAKHSQPAALMSLMMDERIDLGLLNTEGSTALGIALVQVRRARTHREVLAAKALESATGGIRDLFVQRPEARDEAHTVIDVRKRNPGRKLNREAINCLQLVAALVATVTFTAGFTVPGGLIGWDSAPKEDRGMATMLDKREFQVFAICNTVAMFYSVIAIIEITLAQLYYIDVALLARRRAMTPLIIALLATSAAFLSGVVLVLGKLPWLSTIILCFGLYFISDILVAIVSRCIPFVRTRHRLIRLVTFRLAFAYTCWWRIETYLLDTGENEMAGRNSANGHLDGASESNDDHSATTKRGGVPHSHDR